MFLVHVANEASLWLIHPESVLQLLWKILAFLKVYKLLFNAWGHEARAGIGLQDDPTGGKQMDWVHQGN